MKDIHYLELIKSSLPSQKNNNNRKQKKTKQDKQKPKQANKNKKRIKNNNNNNKTKSKQEILMSSQFIISIIGFIRLDGTIDF